MTLPFVEADPLSLSAFSALLLIMLCTLLCAAKKVDSSLFQGAFQHSGRTQIGIIAILAFYSAIVLSGAPGQYFYPVVPVLFIGTLLLSIWFSFSAYGPALGTSCSLRALIGFQCFRVPLELILHHWSKLGTVPATMTWTGQNYDIISGLLALLIFPFVAKKSYLAWIANSVGLILLINVIRVVLMSSPFSFSWQLERPIQLILHMPYALIVPLCVAPALIGHLVVLRVLLLKRAERIHKR